VPALVAVMVVGVIVGSLMMIKDVSELHLRGRATEKEERAF